MSFLERYKGKVIVISHSMCSACQSMKEKAKEDEDIRDKLVFLDVDKDEIGQMIAEVFNIDTYPSFVAVEEKDGKTLICKLDENMEEAESCMEVTVENE